MMDRVKFNISEIFGPTIQGEGLYTGMPSIFVRFSGCNLCCHFAGGSICDTAYTSIHPEPVEPMDRLQVMAKIKELAKGLYRYHVVITGGEPLANPGALVELVESIKEELGEHIPVTIETNGSIVPNNRLISQDVFWSISPKLSSSCCFEGSDIPAARREAHDHHRINLAALAKLVLTENYQLKFVYSGEECVNEIHELVSHLLSYMREEAGEIFNHTLQISVKDIFKHIWLMPEGATPEQLAARSEETVKACIRQGWRFCDRTHIRIWGSKRGV